MQVQPLSMDMDLVFLTPECVKVSGRFRQGETKNQQKHKSNFRLQPCHLTHELLFNFIIKASSPYGYTPERGVDSSIDFLLGLLSFQSVNLECLWRVGS